MGSREKVAEFLSKVGSTEVREFDESTKNASLAAVALGCTVGEIAKSVVFVGPSTVVVVISGDRRVDTDKLARASGGPVRVATPDEVRERTGYPIGGVPPFPHIEGVRVLADSSLQRYRRVWAAAGAPNAVFAMDVDALLGLIGGGVCEVSE